jgi:hypothetical protein
MDEHGGKEGMWINAAVQGATGKRGKVGEHGDAGIGGGSNAASEPLR